MVFDQRNHFGDFAEYFFSGIPAGDPDVVIPNPLAIGERLGDQRAARLASAIYRFFCRMKSSILDSLPCPASSERMPLSFPPAMRAAFRHGEQCPPDLFLILGGRRSTSAMACSSVLTMRQSTKPLNAKQRQQANPVGLASKRSPHGANGSGRSGRPDDKLRAIRVSRVEHSGPRIRFCFIRATAAQYRGSARHHFQLHAQNIPATLAQRQVERVSCEQVG